MVRYLLLITGFGNPHWDEKVGFLKDNLKQLSATVGHGNTLDVRICQYDRTRTLDLTDIASLINGELTVVHKRGFVGDFMRLECTPEFVRANKYDYVVMLLDDVRLQADFDLSVLTQIKISAGMDVVSPCMMHGGRTPYPYMFKQPGSHLLAIVECCEYFCYLMDANAFATYHSYISPDNPSTWGMDLIIVKVMGLKVALCNTMTMLHVYISECYTDLQTSIDQFEKYIASHKTIRPAFTTPRYTGLVYAKIE